MITVVMQRMRRIWPLVLPEVVSVPEEHIWLLRSWDRLAVRARNSDDLFVNHAKLQWCHCSTITIESHNTSFTVSIQTKALL